MLSNIESPVGGANYARGLTELLILAQIRRLMPTVYICEDMTELVDE